MARIFLGDLLNVIHKYVVILNAQGLAIVWWWWCVGEAILGGGIC